MSDEPQPGEFSLYPYDPKSGTYKKMRLEAPIEEGGYTYVSDFFNPEDPKPPFVNIKYNKPTLEALRIFVRDNFGKPTLTPQVANAYLYKFALEHFKPQMTSDWKSFGVDLGKAGENFSIEKLLLPNYREEEVPGATGGSECGFEKDLGLAFAILAVYRVTSVSRADYKLKLMEQAESQLKGIPSLITNFRIGYVHHESWHLDPDYVKIVAAFDMILVKFPKELAVYQKLRFGTVGTRFKDCSCMLAIRTIQKAAGFPSLTAMSDWILLKSVSDSFTAIFKGGQELGYPHSYTPYGSALALFSKSPYSSAAHPVLHNMLHTAGTLLAVGRSKNALLFSMDYFYHSAFNGALMAYGSKYSTRFAKYYAMDDVATSAPEHDPTIVDDPATTFEKCRTANEFLIYLRGNNMSMPKELVEFIKDKKEMLKDSRPGTIGYKMAFEYP